MIKDNTELIMQAINGDMYSGRMPTVQYDQAYEIVYKSLTKITKQNLLKCMKELDIGIIDSLYPGIKVLTGWKE